MKEEVRAQESKSSEHISRDEFERHDLLNTPGRSVGKTLPGDLDRKQTCHRIVTVTTSQGHPSARLFPQRHQHLPSRFAL